MYLEENVVPAIFNEMEEAENSDGFDSCEEHDEDQDSGTPKRTGNPFKDFELDIKEVEDENLASKLSDCQFNFFLK